MVLNMKNLLPARTCHQNVIHIDCYNGNGSGGLIEKEGIIILRLLISQRNKGSTQLAEPLLGGLF